MKVIPGFVKHEPGHTQTRQKLIEARYLYEPDSMPRSGSNPEVFYYQRFPADPFGLIAYRLSLYGGVDVCAALIPTPSKMPSNLVTELISGGVKPVVTVGDKSINFN